MHFFFFLLFAATFAVPTTRREPVLHRGTGEGSTFRLAPPKSLTIRTVQLRFICTADPAVESCGAPATLWRGTAPFSTQRLAWPRLAPPGLLGPGPHHVPNPLIYNPFLPGNIASLLAPLRPNTLHNDLYISTNFVNTQCFIVLGSDFTTLQIISEIIIFVNNNFKEKKFT